MAKLLLKIISRWTPISPRHLFQVPGVRWQAIAQCEVEIAREEKRLDLHLPFSQKSLAGDTLPRCPTDPYPICCPCMKSSPVSKLKLLLGPVLIIVPATIIPRRIQQWREQWMIRSNFWTRFFYIGHRDSRSYLLLNEIDKFQTRETAEEAARQIEHVMLTSNSSYDSYVNKNFRCWSPLQTRNEGSRKWLLEYDGPKSSKTNVALKKWRWRLHWYTRTPKTPAIVILTDKSMDVDPLRQTWSIFIIFKGFGSAWSGGTRI